MCGDGDALQPDVILPWHVRLELLTVARYARAHPDVQLYVDCHEDFNNSARGWASWQLLHASFYRPFCSARSTWCGVLCITVESIQFATDFYRVPCSQVDLFPLAGHIHDDADYHARRHGIRQAHGVAEAESRHRNRAKITANKLLPDALRAFVGTPSEHLRFWIVGTIVDDAESCEALIASDPRSVSWAGSPLKSWKMCFAPQTCSCSPGTNSNDPDQHVLPLRPGRVGCPQPPSPFREQRLPHQLADLAVRRSACAGQRTPAGRGDEAAVPGLRAPEPRLHRARRRLAPPASH